MGIVNVTQLFLLIWCTWELFVGQTTWAQEREEKCIFAALASMKNAVSDENKLLKLAEQYAEDRIEKLKTNRRILEQWKNLHEQSKANLSLLKKSSIQQYKVLKRMLVDWPNVKEKLNNEEDRREFDKSYTSASIPNIKDVRGFARLLVVNSNSYARSIEQMLNTNSSSFISLNNYMELSYRIQFHNLGENELLTLKRASEVAIYGLRKFNDLENVMFSVSTWRFVSNLTDELYEEGLWNLGFELSQQILRLFPDDDEFTFKVELFKDRLYHTQGRDDVDTGDDNGVAMQEPDRKLFNILCRRKDLIVPPKFSLRCFYVYRNSQIRHFASHKAEQVNIDPPIFLFYDVIHDEEIKTMKNFAYPRLSIARVYDPKNPDVSVSEDRISSNAWLLNYNTDTNQSYFYDKMIQRMEDCTGLNRFGSEGIQINNYGLGGHYLWHYDSLYYNAELDYYPDDRIATWMFYLNDVKQGGNTAFIRLNLGIPPIKGSALFWYNLHPSGMNDFRTLHAGCPILEGTKWVTNIWVREYAQIWHKPCKPGQESETSDYASFYKNLKRQE